MADRRLYILLSTFPGSRCCIPSVFWHSCFTTCQVGYCFPIKRIGWVFLEGQLKTSWTIVLCKVGEKQSINIISVEVLLIEESKQWYHDNDVNNNVSFFSGEASRQEPSMTAFLTIFIYCQAFLLKTCNWELRLVLFASGWLLMWLALCNITSDVHFNGRKTDQCTSFHVAKDQSLRFSPDLNSRSILHSK